MDYAAFVERVSHGRVPPVVLVHGPDVQLLDDALATLTRALFPDPAQIDLGREVLDAREVGVDAIVRAALTLPFMTGQRLVAVRRCQALPAKGGEALAAYARDPNPSTCLLLLADEALAASRDRRTDHWLLQAMPASSVVTLPVPNGRSLETWLRQRAAVEGLTIGEEAARLLVQWVGDDTASLLGEARKAALAGGHDNREVGVKQVTAVVGEHRLSDVFDLTRAVERRDAAAALRTLDALLATEEPLRLLALLAADMRTAWAVADLAARGTSVEQIARTLRRPPGAIDAIARSSATLPPAALARRLARCWDVERRLKSSGDARAEMTALVAELCTAR